MSKNFGATAKQLAWYIERDGATVESDPGGVIVRDKSGASWYVPTSGIAELDDARDDAYHAVAERRRANPRCESGWTGDRCTKALYHRGDHSN